MTSNYNPNAAILGHPAVPSSEAANSSPLGLNPNKIDGNGKGKKKKLAYTQEDLQKGGIVLQFGPQEDIEAAREIAKKQNTKRIIRIAVIVVFALLLLAYTLFIITNVKNYTV